jgi:hypothetical protein
VRRWFLPHFRKFDLLPDYFRAIALQWQSILWGGSVIAVLFVILAAILSLPKWTIAVYFVAVLFVAGYYVWRADHIRLTPKLRVSEVAVKPATDTDELGKRCGQSIWVQLVPECLTEAAVERCEAHLIRVLHRYAPDSGIGDGRWDETEMDEPVPLGWSLVGFGPVTLHPGVPQRLNVCTLNDRERRFIRPCINPLPNHAFDVFTRSGQFRFVIRLTARDCAPVEVLLDFERGKDCWDKPSVELVTKRGEWIRYVPTSAGPA